MDRSALVNMECPYTREGVLEGFKAWNKGSSSVWTVIEDAFDFQSDLSGGDAAPTFSFGSSSASAPEISEEKTTHPANQVNLIWSDYEGIDWKRVLANEAVANAYFVRKGLIRKAQLAFNIEKFLSKNPESCLKAGIPETYTLELHHPDYVDEALMELPAHLQNLEGESIWILKPSMCNRGVGIHLFDSTERLEELLVDEDNEDVREWVIQRYVDPPLLVDSRKFHLRAYVLSVGCLEVFLYDQVLALFSLEEYPVTERDLSSYGAHLTNTCYQKRQGTDEDGEIDESKAVRLLEELKGELGAEAIEEVWSQMKKLTGEVFRACSGELGFFPVPNCFELFGLDFLIERKADGSLQVYLLELNAEPDFVQSGDRLRVVINDLLKEATSTVLSHFYPESAPQALPTQRLHSVYQQEESPYMKDGPQMKFHE